MKVLKFDPKRVALIVSGELNVTWRLNDDKHLTVDDEIEFINAQTGEAFGTGIVTEVHTKHFGKVSQDDIKQYRSFDSEEAMYEDFRKYYGPKIGPHSVLKIIRYVFTPYEAGRLPKTLPISARQVKLYADGGSRGNPGPSASGYVLLDMNNEIIKKSGVYLGITTNNQAEYQALKFGMEEALKLSVRELNVFMDSLLVINQMKGIFRVKNRDLWPIHQSIKDLSEKFTSVTYQHVPRELNRLADAEVNEVLDAEAEKANS